MRLKKELIQAREKFVKNLYAATPELSVETINAHLKAEYGMEMAPKRILELKKLATEIEAKVVTIKEPETESVKNDGMYYNARVAFLPLSKNLSISKDKLNIVLEDSDGNQKMHEG